MPAKAKVTKEMIVDAAFAVARETGVENINARTVSERLHCSTQPVMYHFATIEELKRTVYAKADLYHSEYLMTMKKPPKGAALGIGMNYIRFAIEEPHLFRFLFPATDHYVGFIRRVFDGIIYQVTQNVTEVCTVGNDCQVFRCNVEIDFYRLARFQFMLFDECREQIVQAKGLRMQTEGFTAFHTHRENLFHQSA